MMGEAVRWSGRAWKKEDPVPFSVLVGCQWGDEGKGKIVDLLAEEADWVVRFQGGANAGHTVYIDSKQAILHLVPTGILRPTVRCAIGNGVVIDPLALVEELRTIEQLGIRSDGRLAISPFAHLVTPLHKSREVLRQHDQSIGTTKRGIGPAYEDKASRDGLRGEDLCDAGRFAGRLREAWELFRAHITLGSVEAVAAESRETMLWEDFDALLALLEPARARLAPMIADVTDLLLSADRQGARILCEGAQGTWLDIDHGTYPYVTSSNTCTGGACTGLGIPPQRIQRVIGVVKAYCTRVGRGPFPTEFSGPEADVFRERAGEFGATTGRPRRCGWFDAVLVRRSAQINGLTELVVTKLDVLAGTAPLQLATDYRWPADAAGGEGRRWLSSSALEQIEPVYTEIQGWDEDLTAVDDLDGLPSAARAYIDRICDEVGVKLGLVSVGPGRDQVLRDNA